MAVSAIAFRQTNLIAIVRGSVCLAIIREIERGNESETESEEMEEVIKEQS